MTQPVMDGAGHRRRVAVFEQKARRFSGGQHGRINVFWPGVPPIEHKSASVDPDATYQQAIDYSASAFTKS